MPRCRRWPARPGSRRPLSFFLATLPAEREYGVKVRIFTVQQELPFAGHPTLGTAFHLRQQSGASLVELDLKVGKIPVRFSRDDAGGVFGEMRQRDPEFGQIHAAEEVARVLGLELAELETGVPVQTVSTGLPFIIVAFRKLERLRRFDLDFARAAEYLSKTQARFFYFICRETVAPDADSACPHDFTTEKIRRRARLPDVAPRGLCGTDVFQSGQRALIEQGIEICRPSRIFVHGRKMGETVSDIFVGGNVVAVSSGEFVL